MTGYAQTTYEWLETPIEDLSDGDEIIIVDMLTAKAMANEGSGSNPAAIGGFSIADGKLTVDDATEEETVLNSINFIISVNTSSDVRQYTFNKLGTNKYIYHSGSSTDVRIGTGTNNVFIWNADKDRLQNTNSARWLCITTTTNNDWRLYLSGSLPNNPTKTAFFKKTEMPTGISIEAMPAKTTYYTGEALDLTGGKIRITYPTHPAATKDMTATGVTVTGFNPAATGTQTLTVNYRDLTCTFTVIVEEIAYCNISWSENGTVTSVGGQVRGRNITTPAPTLVSKGGKTFKGWTSAATVDPDGEGLTLLGEDSKVPAEEAQTYYAVYATQAESAVITNDDIAEYGVTGHGRYGNYELNGFTGKWMISKGGDPEIHLLQLGYSTDETSGANDSHLTTPALPAPAAKVIIKTNGNTKKGRTFYLTGDTKPDKGCAKEADAIHGSGATTEDNGSVEISVAGAPTQFRIYTNGTAYVESIKVELVNDLPPFYTTTIASSIKTKIGKNGLSTFCSEYPLDFTGLDVTAHIATRVDEGTETEVRMSDISGPVAHCTGLMLRGDASDEGEEIEIPVIDNCLRHNDNMLRPAYQGKVIPKSASGAYRYVFGTKNDKQAFFKLTGDYNNNTGNFSYLESDTDYTATTSGARGLTLRFNDITTDINGVETGTHSNSGSGIYTISGTRVQTPGKGLFIVNGKKVVY